MNAWYIFGGFVAGVFALWVLSVELRLQKRFAESSGGATRSGGGGSE